MFDANAKSLEQNKSQKNKKITLVRSGHDKVFTGVCGGLGENLDVDSNLMRWLFILLSLASGAGIILYVVFYFMMPAEEDVDAEDVMDSGEIYETMAARQRSFMQTNTESNLFQQSGRGLGEHKFQLDTSRAYIPTENEAGPGEMDTSMAGKRVLSRRNMFGLLIVFVGMIFMVNNIIPWYWISPVARMPLLIIFVGLAFVIKSNKN
jgi:phage shock protein C